MISVIGEVLKITDEFRYLQIKFSKDGIRNAKVKIGVLQGEILEVH